MKPARNATRLSSYPAPSPKPNAAILIGTITNLSGVTAVQGVNNANAVRLASTS